MKRSRFAVLMALFAGCGGGGGSAKPPPSVTVGSTVVEEGGSATITAAFRDTLSFVGRDSCVQRYTPRRAKSIWSQANREHVARLTAAGRMTVHGQRQVDAAKADGQWDAAYARSPGPGAPPVTGPAVSGRGAAGSSGS